METENIEPEKLDSQGSWEEMNRRLALVKDYCDEEKLENDYARILR